MPRQKRTSLSNPLRICLVTSFPPSRGDLNEYGFHLACALRDRSDVELIVLADDANAQDELAGFDVRRCWRFNSLLSPLRLLWRIKRTQPDVVWFNMGFSTFASNPVAAFLSIAVPLLARWMGYSIHVTLHTIFERINLDDAGVRSPALYRIAGRVATRMLLWSGDVSVLMPSFRSELLSRYRVSPERVHFRPHGTFSNSEQPARTQDEGAEPIILAFGFWGTYKKLELVLDSMEEIVRRVPNAILEIAGANHPNAPGYLEALEEKHRGKQYLRFLGYVAEDELPRLFQRARLLVLPYSSAAGTSGVVHQACQYGLPIVAAEIPEFAEMAVTEGITMQFYSQGDGRTLVQLVSQLLESDELCRGFSEQNLAAALGTPMTRVVDDYVQSFRTRVARPGMEGRESELPIRR